MSNNLWPSFYKVCKEFSYQNKAMIIAQGYWVAGLYSILLSRVLLSAKNTGIYTRLTITLVPLVIG